MLPPAGGVTMYDDPLTRKIDTTVAVLSDRLDEARSHPDTRDRPRDRYPAIDTFLASCSQHLAGITAVLLPEARHRLDDGPQRDAELSHRLRNLEVALNGVKARLYGSAYAVGRRWGDVWQEVSGEFDATTELERRLGRDLAGRLTHEQSDDLTERLYRAEQGAPTRPHPFVPHHGVPGRVARRVARRIDRFWDTAECRMIPEPVRDHDREHDGLLTQYLLADPHLDAEDAGEDTG